MQNYGLLSVVIILLMFNEKASILYKNRGVYHVQAGH